MIAKEYINSDIPYLKVTDSLDYALSIMEDYKISHIPVIDENQEYVGIIDENAVLDFTDFDTEIGQVPLLAKNSIIEPQHHIYEVLRYCVENHTSIIPVSNDKRQYLGSIDCLDILSVLGELNAVSTKGAVLILDMKQSDYSMSEIAKIAEDSNVQILSSGISSNTSEPSRIFVTLKFDKEIIQNAIASYSRYDYSIVASFQADSHDDDKERLDHLFKYLDI